ncbi:PREDICTED: M-phase phosphoprotein 8-like [Priapulus caudatus]|uniref:M-phase phosphoprotein 8-like n=1 Tax=Priapulus caudatus TaxID=37621 RepID=A0ABM1EZ02_PRICU|nr:PREDICTED: M-phase phosphoprotein 8-like [Priapulus caudatus]
MEARGHMEARGRGHMEARGRGNGFRGNVFVRRTKTLYKVRWLNYQANCDTWEPYDNLLSCKDLVHDYLTERKRLKEEKMKREREQRDQQPTVSGEPQVKDTFWNDLEAGKINVFESDLYTKVKGRCKKPASYNEDSIFSTIFSSPEKQRERKGSDEVEGQGKRKGSRSDEVEGQGKKKRSDEVEGQGKSKRSRSDEVEGQGKKKGSRSDEVEGQGKSKGSRSDEVEGRKKQQKQRRRSHEETEAAAAAAASNDLTCGGAGDKSKYARAVQREPARRACPLEIVLDLRRPLQRRQQPARRRHQSPRHDARRGAGATYLGWTPVPSPSPTGNSPECDDVFTLDGRRWESAPHAIDGATGSISRDGDRKDETEGATSREDDLRAKHKSRSSEKRGRRQKSRSKKHKSSSELGREGASTAKDNSVDVSRDKHKHVSARKDKSADVAMHVHKHKAISQRPEKHKGISKHKDKRKDVAAHDEKHKCISARADEQKSSSPIGETRCHVPSTDAGATCDSNVSAVGRHDDDDSGGGRKETQLSSLLDKAAGTGKEAGFELDLETEEANRTWTEQVNGSDTDDEADRRIGSGEFRQAVKDGDYRTVRRAARYSELELAGSDASGMSLLMVTAISAPPVGVSGHVAVAAVLLTAGAHANTKSLNGETALLKACRKGHRHVVRLLADHGADFGETSTTGHSALQLACMYGHHGCASLVEGHRERIKRVFEAQVGPTLNNTAVLLQQLFPVRCVSLDERSEISIAFDYRLPDDVPPPGIGSLLFIAHAAVLPHRR